MDARIIKTKQAIQSAITLHQCKDFSVLVEQEASLHLNFSIVNKITWEQRKLGDVIDVRSGRDYKHLQTGEIPVYGTGGYMLSVNEALSYQEDAIGIGRKG